MSRVFTAARYIVSIEALKGETMWMGHGGRLVDTPLRAVSFDSVFAATEQAKKHIVTIVGMPQKNKCKIVMCHYRLVEEQDGKAITVHSSRSKFKLAKSEKDDWLE